MKLRDKIFDAPKKKFTADPEHKIPSIDYVTNTGRIVSIKNSVYLYCRDVRVCMLSLFPVL